MDRPAAFKDTTEDVFQVGVRQKENPTSATTKRGAPSTLKTRSRSVIFSPHSSSHPFSPNTRSALSSYGRNVKAVSSPSATPTRSILKRTNSDDIRLAKDVVEGTRVNGRSDRRSYLSDQAAMMSDDAPSSNPASDDASVGVARGLPSSSPPPSSSPENGDPSGGADGKEPSVVQSIASHLRTILSISPSHREDAPHLHPTSLGDLAEAYTSLTTRFRSFAAPSTVPNPKEFQQFLAPLKENSAALYRAFKRDLERVFKQSQPKDARSSSPPEVPAEAETYFQAGRAPRVGFSDLEISVRREEVSVGHAVLKWLALAFHVPEIWGCFTDADILSLLRLLLKIPLQNSTSSTSLTMPFFTATSATKRTYAFSIYALTHLRLPTRILQPVADDIVEACRRATTTPPSGTSAAAVKASATGEGNPKAKIEGLGAIYNLLSRNASLFLLYHEDLFPILFKSLTDKTPSVRTRASAALGASIIGGRDWIREAEQALAVAEQAEKAAANKPHRARAEKEKERRKQEEELMRARRVVEEEVGLCVVKQLKLKIGKGPEKILHGIIVQLKSALSKDAGHWAVSTWALLITLLGRNIATHISELLTFLNEARGVKTRGIARLCRLAWDHVIVAFVSQSSGRLSAVIDPPPSPSNDPIRYDLAWVLNVKRTKLLAAFMTASITRDVAPPLEEVVGEDGKVIGQRWTQRETGGIGSKADLMRISVEPLVGSVFALTGAIYNTLGQPREMPLLPSAEAEGDQSLSSIISGSAPGKVLVPVSVSSKPTLSSGPPTLNQIRNAQFSEVFDAIVQPVLKDLLAIAGADDMKLLAWSILGAIFATDPNSSGSSDADDHPATAWTLERLLCHSFLRGDISSAEPSTNGSAQAREDSIWNMAQTASASSVTPEEIPSWPKDWVATRFSTTGVKTVESAIFGIHGLSNTEGVEWVRSVEGIRILPAALSNLWRNNLRAHAMTKPEGDAPASKEYLDGLMEITRFIKQVLKTPPAIYLPPTLLHAQTSTYPDLVRYGLVEHLVSVAADVLGDGAFAAPLPLKDNKILGANKEGRTSVAGILVTSLMQMKLPSFANDPAGRIAFCAILDKLITVGLSGSGASGSLLGDLTHTLDVLETEGDEDVTQLSLWRVIARKWTELWPKTAPTSQEDDEDAEREDQSTPLKNPSMTLGLLANLLTNPFRSCPGSWAVASDSDVKIWQDLLETTCARARVKAYDPNIAVVESLAAGLTDAEVAEKPSPSTLKCLATLALAIRFPGSTPPTNDTNLAFQRRMRSLPDSFLNLLGESILKGYDAAVEQPDLAGPLSKLMTATASLLAELPVGFVGKAVDILSSAFQLVVADEKGVFVDAEYQEAAISLYEKTLQLLSTSAETKEGDVYRVIDRSNATLLKLTPLLCINVVGNGAYYVRSADTFAAFWDATFQGVENLTLSDRLREMLCLLHSTGMNVDAESLSISQSQSQLPTPFTHRSEIEPPSTTINDSREVVGSGHGANTAAHRPSTSAGLPDVSASTDGSIIAAKLATATQGKSQEESASSAGSGRSLRTRASSAQAFGSQSQATIATGGVKRSRNSSAGPKSASKRLRLSSSASSIVPPVLEDSAETLDLDLVASLPTVLAPASAPAVEATPPPPPPAPIIAQTPLVPMPSASTPSRRAQSQSVLSHVASRLNSFWRSPTGAASQEEDTSQTMKSFREMAESMPVTEDEARKVRIGMLGKEEATMEERSEGPGGDVDQRGGALEAPKSARRAHRQTARAQRFGTGRTPATSFDQSISLAPPGNGRRLFDQSTVPSTSSGSEHSPAKRAAPCNSLPTAEDEDEEEPTDVDDDDDEEASDQIMAETSSPSPLSKRFSNQDAASRSSIFPASPVPPPASALAAPSAAITSFVDLLSDEAQLSQELAGLDAASLLRTQRQLIRALSKIQERLEATMSTE